MKKSKSLGIIARIALFTATLIWGSSFILMKSAVDIIPTPLLLSIRFTTACLILAAVLALLGQWKDVTKKDVLHSAFAGICLFVAYYFQTLGIERTTPGKNAFLTAVYCVIVPFLYWAIGGKKNRPGIDNITAALMCVAGIGFISLDGALSVNIGDVLTLVGGFMFAAHIIVLAKATDHGNPMVITCIQFGFSAAFSWIAYLFTVCIPAWMRGEECFTPATLLSEMTGSLAFSLIYLCVCCTTVCFLLQTVGQKFTPPGTVSIILSFESVFGVIFSVIFYHEKMTVQLVSGFVLIFAAVIISESGVFSKLRKNKSELSEN